MNQIEEAAAFRNGDQVEVVPQGFTGTVQSRVTARALGIGEHDVPVLSDEDRNLYGIPPSQLVKR